MKYVIGVDTGGTFTDITVLSETGDVYIDKSPTTPHDFSQGVMNAIAKIASSMTLTSDELLQSSTFKHGTTVATNALITRSGSVVGLITTKGFEDTTLVMRAIGRVAGLGEDELKHQSTCVKPVPIVPKSLIRGVSERIDARGEVVVPINEDEVRAALRYLIEDKKVYSIAVNLLFSFANAVHERAIKELAREMYGDELRVRLTYSHELAPVVREYARANTVILDAFLHDTVHTYISALERKLYEAGLGVPLLLMQSNGGIVHKDQMTAIGTTQSGPCGGMIASKHVADALGHKEVITTDMGGTSFDAGIIAGGHWRYMREPVVERFHITWPMVAVESIGAGGGTIARVDEETGRLRLGPQSAGASPGPVCYGAGGREPTVTDADLVLGLLNPDFFLGGRMKLHPRLAEEALAEKIARPLGVSVIEAAAGIYDVVNSHMSDLIRKQVVSSGKMPEEFVLYAFGGAGPVHAAAFGADLGVSKICVFPTSAVFSSMGVAVSDIIHTHTASHRHQMPVAPEELNRVLAGIEHNLLQGIMGEGVGVGDVRFRRTFYMRYRRQLNELPVEVPAEEYDKNAIYGIMAEFESRYEDTYGKGSAYSEAGIELISIRVDAIAKTQKPSLKTHPKNGTTPERRALKGYRDVFFTATNDFLRTPIFDYLGLQAGNVVEGAAIVETPITTVVVPPGFVGSVDGLLNIEISK